MKRVINERNQAIVVSQLEIAETFFSRLMGLMGRQSFPQGEGLLLKRSGNSIHTCFMNFPIDVAFITRRGEIKYMRSAIKPWRFVIAPLLEGTDCLELPGGTLETTDTKIGDVLRVEA